MIREYWATILLAGVFLFIAGGCVTSNSTGITVDTLRRPDLTEWEQCGEVSLVLVEVDSASGVGKEYTRVVSEKAKAILGETPYFTMREMIDEGARKGPAEIVAAHHFLEFQINMLEISGDRTRKEIDIGIAAHLKKESGDSYIECGVKEFSDSYVWQGKDLPSQNIMVSEASERTLKRLIRMIAPKKVSVYREIKGGSGKMGDVAHFLDNGNCELAKETASKIYDQDPDNPKAVYDLGVASECLASQSREQKEKLRFLRKAKHYYSLYMKKESSDEAVQMAMQDVSRSIRLYEKAFNKQKNMQNKMDDGEEGFGGKIN